MSNKAPDVFHAFLVKNASFDGIYEIPCIKGSKNIPTKIISFSKAISSTDYDCWVMFYEHDTKFTRIWNTPNKYIPILKKFKGIISPDFSLYRDMPLSMQIWNTYRGKAFAHFCEVNGIDVIPNVRFSDNRSFNFCFLGIPKNGIVSVGTHGCIQNKLDRHYFKIGLQKLVETLSPNTIIVYGSAPNDIFSICVSQGINIVQFDSEILLYHKSKKTVI